MTTKTAQFTPGPWFYNYDDHCIVNQAGVSIVNVRGAMSGNDTNADIALIAAAPAMYEALKAALDYYRGVFTGNTVTDEMMSSKLEQALAQAEGK